MNAFAYRGGRLHAEGVALDAIAETYGTPVYVYSQAAIEDAYRELAEALKELRVRICYAVKANGNLAVIRSLAALGAGADVVSGGELARAVAAGVGPAEIVFSGVGKTREEMAQGLKAGIGQFNVESEAELAVLGEVAAGLGATANTAIRVNPDVAVDTADEIATGRYEHKFGIPIEDAARIYQRGAATPGIRMVGLATHIGSQILDLAPFESAFAVLAECVQGLRKTGFAVERLDLGGGLGIAYVDETAPSPAEFADVVRRTVGGLGCGARGGAGPAPGRQCGHPAVQGSLFQGNAGKAVRDRRCRDERPAEADALQGGARCCSRGGLRRRAGDPPRRRGGTGLRDRRLSGARGRSAHARGGRPDRDQERRRLRRGDGVELQ